jgi:type VI secretion system secreted protein VgrG
LARKIITNVEIDSKTILPISYLSIHQPVNWHHSFELRCPLKEKDKSLVDAGNSFIGKEVKIEIVSGVVKNAKNFFKGYVTGVSLSKQQGTANEIIYVGFGPTVLMDDGQHSQSFEKKTLDKIAREVASKYGISIRAGTAYKSPLPYFVQYRETSFLFLSRLASLYGEWFYYDGEDLYFGKPPNEEPVELVFGRDLSNFDLALNLVPVKFKQLGYDPLGHKFPESSSSAANVTEMDDYGKIAAGASEKVFKNEPVVATNQEIQDKSDLDEFTKHRKTGKAGNFVQFSGTSDNNKLKPGSIITVKGKIGDKASAIGWEVTYGEYRIINISHSTDALGNYQNNFKAIPSGLAEPPTNPLVIHPICEIQPADVIENHDPEKLGRVRVQLQWQKATSDKTPWIRVAASGAGGTHGAFFVPEIGDQVLVGFEHNNPNKPYVMGTLYHGKAKPADDLSDPENNKKIIKTKSGNKIAFTDEGGKEEIKIESGTNVITLAMDGGSSITLTTKGAMTLKAKTISINASQTVTISGGSMVSIKSGSEQITLQKGAKTEISGSKTAVKGSGTAEVTSPTTTINGDTAVNVTAGTIKLN